jgi:hypothetical protein
MNSFKNYITKFISVMFALVVALFLSWNPPVVADNLTGSPLQLVQIVGYSNSENSVPLGELKKNQKLWERQGIFNYRYTLSNDCFCISEFRGPVIIEVRDGSTTNIVSADTAMPVNSELFQKYDTVPKLFDLIKDAIANGEDLSVEYDHVLGYPTQINIGNLAADAGIITTVKDLQEI